MKNYITVKTFYLCFFLFNRYTRIGIVDLSVFSVAFVFFLRCRTILFLSIFLLVSRKSNVLRTFSLACFSMLQRSILTFYVPLVFIRSSLHSFQALCLPFLHHPFLFSSTGTSDAFLFCCYNMRQRMVTF